MTADAPPPLAPPAGGPSRATLLVLLGLLCLPFLVGLGEPPLWDANEPLYAQPPKEALETGDWLAPPWNGRPWFVHPPLSSWVTIPSYALFGVSPFSARLPLALLAVATILATFALGRAVAGRRGGLLAAAVLATTARYWLFARQLAGDVLLVACLAGAFAAVVPALRSAGRDGRRRLLLAYALVGVGVLAKGPVIVVLFLGPLLLAARFAAPRVPWRALRPFAFVALVLALGAPWFVYMTWRFGGEYLEVYFGHHHVRRAVSDDAGSRPPWYYLVALAGDAQPWILFVPAAVHRAWKARDRDPVRLLCGIGALFPLLLFSLSLGKRNVYLLPLYPMLAAFLAPFLVEAWDGVHDRFARIGGALLAAAAAACAVLLLVGARNVPDEIAAGSRVYLGICVVGFLVALLVAARGRGRHVVGATIGIVGTLLLASALLLPVLGRFMPVPRLARTLVAAAAPGEPAIVYRTGIHSLRFYADRPTGRAASLLELRDAIPPGGRGFVLGGAHVVDEIVAAPRFVVRELDRAPLFKFQFRWNIRGEGRSTRDLVLLEVRREADPEPARSTGDR